MSESKGEEPIRLTEEQMEMVRQATKEFERGESVTPEEARKVARERTKAWLKKVPGESA